MSEPYNVAVVLRARELCRQECRALLCERNGRCLATWPGCDGGKLEHYLRLAAYERSQS